MPMGDKFRGFKGNGCIYIVEIVPKFILDNVCNEFMFITRAYIVGEFVLYMLVLLTSLALVVAGFDMD